MNILVLYLLFGVGLYVGVSVSRLSEFKDATLFEIIKDFVIVLLLWPIGVTIMVMQEKISKR